MTDAPSWPLGHVLGREFRPFAFIISLSTTPVTVSLLTATVRRALLAQVAEVIKTTLDEYAPDSASIILPKLAAAFDQMGM